MYKVAIEYVENYRLEEIKKTLRKCFTDLGFPEKHPLNPIVYPRHKVFIKPNWIASRCGASCPYRDILYYASLYWRFAYSGQTAHPALIS